MEVETLFYYEWRFILLWINKEKARNFFLKKLCNIYSKNMEYLRKKKNMILHVKFLNYLYF